MTEDANDASTLQARVEIQSASPHDGVGTGPVIDAALSPATDGAAPAPPPPTPAVAIDRPAKRGRPVLGPALMVAGAALWAFVVFGTYTTSWLPGGDGPLGSAVAALVTVMITISAWVVSVRRGFPSPTAGAHESAGRYASVAVVAFGLWLVAVCVATFVGRTSATNLDLLLASALLAVAALAGIAGDRLTGRPLSRRSPPRRVFVLAGWLAVGLTTLGSFVELVAEH